MNKKSNMAGKIVYSIFAIVILAICLSTTTLALVYPSVSVDNNLFETAVVKINLNDGKPIIEGNEYLFQPGTLLEKDFFLENQGTCNVYYRIYFNNIMGELANLIDVSIHTGDKVIFNGKLSALNKAQAETVKDVLLINERKVFTASFYFSHSFGNEVQNLGLSFELSADAVQANNNPNQLFD